jgi:hypothetical protein
MYNTKFFACFLLVTIVLLGCTLSNVEAQSSTVSLHVFGSSSLWWIAVQPRGDNGQTTKIELKDASMSNYVTLTVNQNWGYWSTSSVGNGFQVPITFRLTSSSGAVITTQISSVQPDQLLNTGLSYGSSSSGSSNPTSKPPTAPTTRPSNPTSAPTSKPSTPTTAPTSKPSIPTSAPTSKPSTPTTAPTSKPSNPTTPPVSGDLCALTSVASEPLKIMVPLYTYPGASWDALVAGASKVKILAIINPNSGPATSVDSSYSSYMTKLKNAGVEMVGYVYTSYGARDINAVKADIDTYVSKYPLITGIFLDEGANDASKISFYTQVYNYIIAKPGYKHVILNPGAQTDQGYMAITTNIMIYENYGSSLASTTLSRWVKCAPTASQKTGYKYHFSGVAHTASSSVQASYVQTLATMGMGYVYVTDGAGGCCTYNSLTSYFPALVDAVAAANRAK